jgi:hypothetical protein
MGTVVVKTHSGRRASLLAVARSYGQLRYDLALFYLGAIGFVSKR